MLRKTSAVGAINCYFLMKRLKIKIKYHYIIFISHQETFIVKKEIGVFAPNSDFLTPYIFATWCCKPLIFQTKIEISGCLSDHNSGTPELICLKFWLVNTGEPWKCSKLSFEILSGSTCIRKKAKLIIYDKVRVNSGSNYVTWATLGLVDNCKILDF